MSYSFDRRDDDPPGDVYFVGIFGLYGPMTTADNPTPLARHIGFASDLWAVKLIGHAGTYELKSTFFGRKQAINVNGEAMVQFEQQGMSEKWHLLEGGRILTMKPVAARKHILDERGQTVVVVRNGWTSQDSQMFQKLARQFWKTSWTAGEGETDTSTGRILFVNSQNLGPDLELVLATLALTS